MTGALEFAAIGFTSFIVVYIFFKLVFYAYFDARTKYLINLIEVFKEMKQNG